MTTRRFYAPDASHRDQVLELPRGEARQLAQVLRLGSGAVVQVFDGRGKEFSARVESVERTAVTVRTLDACSPAPEASVRLTLATAVLKGRATDGVVRDATMLGAAALQPLQTARSRPAPEAPDALLERWQAIAISSAKQCGRAVVPAVGAVCPFAEFLAPCGPETLRLLLVEPSLRAAHVSPRRLAANPAPAQAVIAVGPEGGWTETEVGAAEAAGFTLLALGKRTLRAEAAPAVAITVLQHVWDDL